MRKMTRVPASRLLAAALSVLVAMCTGLAAETAKTAKTADKPQSPPLEVQYDPVRLPEPVAAMRDRILEAARSGDVEEMVPALQSNELMPMLADKRVEDAAAFFKEQSADGTGRDILAIMINVLESGYVKLNVGGTETYVWPYFAEIPLDTLTPAQQVDLYRVVPAAEVKAMREAGKYLHYSLGIGPDGTWHYFVRNK